MKRFLFLLLISISLTLSTGCKEKKALSESLTYDVISTKFCNPEGQARPKVYWWLLNGYIDTVKVKEEFASLKNAGITGIDLFEIGSRDKMIPAGPAFLSDESLKIIKFVVDEAAKYDLTVGLNLASSWNAGGSWIEAKHGGKSLYRSEIRLAGNSELQKVKLPFPEIDFPASALIGGIGKSLIPFRDDGRPEYYEEISVLAIPADIEKGTLEVSELIDLTEYFNPETDELTWEAPEGEWNVYRYICSNSGQQLVLPSPYSAGLTIDHFDSEAVKSHLMYIINRLKPVLGDFRNTALKSFYLASYEARGLVWSSGLPEEFKKLHGYDINKYLELFFNKELFDKETTNKVQIDFRKTLSEMMITNLYKNAREICNKEGLKINCEAGGPGYPHYNGPAEPLKALGALDLPRGEFWVNHARYYMDTNGIDSIDILRVVKEVSAASHIYERGIVEEEAFTSFEHWLEGPFDLKPIGDRAFCEGMNRVVFHGYTHSPAEFGQPGIVYHAGTHMNNRVWWPMVNPFIDYLSRISYIFQETDFIADVVWYYGDKVPNAATPKNTHFKVGPGYDYEVINTEILVDKLSVMDGRLIMPYGASFSMLALENEEIINPAVLGKLAELAEQGAVIVGEKPLKVADMPGHPYSGEKGQKLIEQLWTSVKDPSGIKAGKKAAIYSGISPARMMAALEVPSDFDYADKQSWLIDYIHYQKDDIDFYFIRNTSDEWISRDCGFRHLSKVPEIWDPLTGNIIPVRIYREEDNYTRIPITLAPYGSFIVVLRPGQAPAHYLSVEYSGQNPPKLEFMEEGIFFSDEGNYSLKSSSGIVELENKIIRSEIDGPWKVYFDKKWGAPDSIVFPELISWTGHEIPGIKYFSGIVRYQKTFNYDLDEALSEGEKVFLDLGEISEVAAITLNGQEIGISWAKPFRLDISGAIKNGENVLSVAVANTWCNRIIGDAIRAEKYTNTNISRVGQKTRDQVPLNPSGLLGPVTVSRIKLIN